MIAETKKIKSFDDLELNLSLVENGSPVWIIVTHGLGEHGQRHSYFDRNFSQNFNICRWDLRGHGKSEGERAKVEKFSDFVSDLDAVINYLKDNYKMNRYILFAHSMGALITSSFMQKKVRDNLYPEKVFLSGPVVAGAGLFGKVFDIAPHGLSSGLSKINTSLALAGMLDIKKLSHDSRVYESYIADPLNSLKIHTKLFFNILAESKDVFSRPLRVQCPLYVAIATGDVLIDPKAAIKYFKQVEKNANLFEVEGGYHELHNEIEKFKKPYMEFLKESLLDSIYS